MATSASLLALCQQASREMGITAPATIISNTDLYAVQLLNLINGLGQDLVKEHQWQGLSKEYRFSTVFFEYTGDSTVGSTTLANMSSIASLTGNFMVQGTGIPTDTFVTSATGTDVVITREATVTATTTTFTFSQVQYSLPSDFDRVIDRTEWDKTQSWELIGPGTAQQWQLLKSGFTATGVNEYFRVMGDEFVIYPPLGSENYYGFEYVSTQWVAATGAALSKTAFAVDTDTCTFPDRLMIQGLKLRFSLSKTLNMHMWSPIDIQSGFPMRILSALKAADAGSPILSMSPRARSILIDRNNIPDSGLG